MCIAIRKRIKQLYKDNHNEIVLKLKNYSLLFKNGEIKHRVRYRNGD